MANEAERAESGETQLAPARVAGGTRCASVVKGPVAALWMACRTAGRQDPRTPRGRRATQAGKTICRVVPVVGLSLLSDEGVSAKCRE